MRDAKSAPMEDPMAADHQLLPASVRRVVSVVLGSLVVFALYLLALRGPAMFIDLAQGIAAFCM